MTQQLSSQCLPPTAHTAVGLGLLSTMAMGVVLFTFHCSQIVAQRPASNGVVVFHLGNGGDLRVWNQPIRPQEVPGLLERARRRAGRPAPLIVRLIPGPQVPWGAVNGMLSRLRPTTSHDSWVLQLQLP